MPTDKRNSIERFFGLPAYSCRGKFKPCVRYDEHLDVLHIMFENRTTVSDYLRGNQAILFEKCDGVESICREIVGVGVRWYRSLLPYTTYDPTRDSLTIMFGPKDETLLRTITRYGGRIVLYFSEEKLDELRGVTVKRFGRLKNSGEIPLP